VAFRRRLARLLVLTALGLGAIWGRVAWLQVVDRDTWVAYARDLRRRGVTLPAPRGRIVDADGRPLARDVSVPQLAIVAYDWMRRNRVRCTACGAILCYGLGERPPTRCPCHDPASRLEPLPLPDYGALERALGLRQGELAERAEDRVLQIERMRAAQPEILAREGTPDFMIHDAVRLYY
jgi:hypothetical protein